jgi:hypothetical protein
MLEYILQTIFLFSVLFVYMLFGSVVYSAVGEGYKATPLRCFAVGVASWILIVVVSSVLFSVNLEYLWWFFVVLTVSSLFLLPKKDQEETLDKRFFLQVFYSFLILLPFFVFLHNDSLHFWQEFAIYGKGLFSLLNQNQIMPEFFKLPFAYQLAILPVGYFTEFQDSIFACFNLSILAFVACEFVRNSGVKFNKGNVVFPLIIALALLVVLNPFTVKDLILSADPFIFVCAIGFAFSEYIFRVGFLPKSLAAIPAALILTLLAIASTQGFLLGCSLFLVLTLRYLIQSSTLNYKQVIGYFLILIMPTFIILLWKFNLSSQGLSFLLFDVNNVTFTNISLFYQAMYVLLKQHIMEVLYVSLFLLLSAYSFTKVKKLEDIIVDRFLVRTVFWIMVVYIFICVPIFFSQYEYVARASYSLGFTTISLIQFIVLMPIGRLIKDALDKMDIKISFAIKSTIILSLIIAFVMNRNYLQTQSSPQIDNIKLIAKTIQQEIPDNANVAFVDINKMVNFYKNILSYETRQNINFVNYSYSDLPESLENSHKLLKTDSMHYVLLHSPNNLLIKSFEHNLDPNYSYLYEINDAGFVLIKKFENKLYKDSNIIIK